MKKPTEDYDYELEKEIKKNLRNGNEDLSLSNSARFSSTDNILEDLKDNLSPVFEGAYLKAICIIRFDITLPIFHELRGFYLYIFIQASLKNRQVQLF